MRRKAPGVILVGLAAVAMSGCFLRFTLGTRLAETLSEEIELIVDAIRTEATTAVCQTDPFFSPFFQRCTYFINGVEVASTTSLLRELGPFGAMIDPIVLELPARASIAGTFTGGARNVSHSRGFFLRSTFTRGAEGTHVPFAIASSTMRRWRCRSSSECATIAEETPRNERCEEGVHCGTKISCRLSGFDIPLP